MGASKGRRARSALIVAAAFLTPHLAGAVNITWSGGGSTSSWSDFGNWTGGLPNANNDAFLGTGFGSGTIITIPWGSPAQTTVNSLTINTVTGFTLRRTDAGGSLVGVLSLDTGNLTRLSVTGTEADHVLETDVGMGSSTTSVTGTWNINGSNSLIVRGYIVNYEGQTASLIKSGSGRLILSRTFPYGDFSSYNGTTNITDGYLRLRGGGGIGDGTVTVADGAVLELESHNGLASSPLRLSGTGAATFPFGTTGAVNVVAGSNAWTGPVTLLANSSINCDGGSLSLTGVIPTAHRPSC